MSPKTEISYSPEDTFKLGIELAKQLSPGSCVLLNGDLGAGKTQLIKGMASFFGIKTTDVQSPTYSLHHEYHGTQTIHHFDLYRLKSTKEFLDRGFLDIIENNEPVFIEWPSRIDSQIFNDKSCVVVNLIVMNQDQREIQISYGKN